MVLSASLFSSTYIPHTFTHSLKLCQSICGCYCLEYPFCLYVNYEQGIHVYVRFAFARCYRFSRGHKQSKNQHVIVQKICTFVFKNNILKCIGKKKNLPNCVSYMIFESFVIVCMLIYQTYFIMLNVVTFCNPLCLAMKCANPCFQKMQFFLNIYIDLQRAVFVSLFVHVFSISLVIWWIGLNCNC